MPFLGVAGYLLGRKLAKNYKRNSNPDNSAHDAYMDSIRQEMGDSEFNKVIENNPYISDYGSPTLWDKIGNALNIHTAEDKYRLEQQQMMRDEAYKALTTWREEQHNSIANQAAQMRAAGQNPDLLGTPSEAGLASEMPEPETLPSYDLDTMDKSLANFNTMVVDSLMTGISMFGQFSNIRGQILNNEGQELSNFLSAINGGSALWDTISPHNPDGEYNIYDMMSAVSNSFFGKKSARKFNSIVKGFAPSAKATIITNRNASDVLTSRLEYMKKQNNEFYREAQKVSSPVIERLVQLENDVYVKQMEAFKAEQEGAKEYAENFNYAGSAEAQNAENQVAATYNKNLDAKQAAELTNKTNKAELLNQDIKMMMAKAYHDIVNRLYDTYQKEKNFKGGAAQAGLIGMSVISTLIANGGAAQMISAAIPRSSTSNVNTNSNVSSRSESHSYNENYNYNMSAGSHR